MLRRTALAMTLTFVALAGQAAAQAPATDPPRELVRELHRTPFVPGRVLRVDPATSTALVSTAYGDVRVNVPLPLRNSLRVGDTIDLQLAMSPIVGPAQVGQGPTLPDGRGVYPGPAGRTVDPGADVRTAAPGPGVTTSPTTGDWVRVEPPGASSTPRAARPGCRQLERRVYDNGQLVEQSVRELCP
jgi:hypothetical protein